MSSIMLMATMVVLSWKSNMMVCLSIIFDFHDSTTIVAISMIDDMLDPSVRKVYIILSLNIASFITRPFFTKFCVILVIMHSILEVERIRFLIVMISTMSPNNTTNTSIRARQAECWDKEGEEQW